jgi:hypothetical protein
MSEPSERIHAALLRFKAERSAAGGQQVEPTEPDETVRQLIVVNEQNLAALFLSSVSRSYPEAASRKLAATKVR